jgi:uncharacterized membrane protein YbhN (UPF0104 family)
VSTMAVPETTDEVPDADLSLPDIPEPTTPADRATAVGTGPKTLLVKVASVAVPILIAGAAVSVVAAAAGDSAAMTSALSSVSPGMVSLALVCEVVSYVCLGLHLRWLAGPDDNVRRLAPFRVALVVFGLGSVMPAAPAEGLVMAGAALKHRRLARRRTVLVLGMSQVFGTAGLYALAALDALAVFGLAHDGPLPWRWLLVVGGAGALVALALGALLLTRPRVAELVGLACGWLRRPRRPAPAGQRRAQGAAWHSAAMYVLRERHNAPRLAAAVLLAWLADGSCLYFALSGVGAPVSLDVLLLAYSIGVAACMIPFLPAGLGVIETVTPLLLHFYGVPIETALAALVIYRALGTFLPALAGGLALGALRLPKPPAEPRLPTGPMVRRSSGARRRTPPDGGILA